MAIGTHKVIVRWWELLEVVLRNCEEWRRGGEEGRRGGGESEG